MIPANFICRRGWFRFISRSRLSATILSMEAAQKVQKTDSNGTASQRSGGKDVVRVDGQEISGIVKWWNVEKGYGFLTADDGGPDLFLHQSEIQTERFRALLIGQEVEGKFFNRNGKPILLKIQGKGGSSLPVINSRQQLSTGASIYDLSNTDHPGEPPLEHNTHHPGEPPLEHGFLRGSIKWYNQEKGFGFILPDSHEQGSADIFIHASHLRLDRIPTTGERLHYSTKADKNGRTVAGAIKFLTPPVNPLPVTATPYAFQSPVPYGVDPYASNQQYSFPGAPQAGPQPPAYPPNSSSYSPYGGPQPASSSYAPQTPAAATYDPYGATAQGAAGASYDPYAQQAAGASYDPYHQQAAAGGQQGYFPSTLPNGKETGTVKFYNEDKKFGFILPSPGAYSNADLYFKADDVDGPAGQYTSGVGVQFIRKSGRDGKMWAVEVQLAPGGAGGAAQAYPGQPGTGKRKFDSLAGYGQPPQHQPQPPLGPPQPYYNDPAGQQSYALFPSGAGK
eukprot:g18637.t1